MTEMASKRKSTVSRRMTADDEHGGAVHRHAQLAGELLWAWNELNSSFGMLFASLVDPQNAFMGMTLWTTVANESTQRALLLGASEAAIGLSEKDRERIAWVLKQTDKLAGYRNDIVHGTVGYRLSEKGITTRLSYAGNSFGRLYRHAQIDMPLEDLMKVVRGDLMALSGYITGLWRASDVGPGREVTFDRPRRPQLKTFRVVEVSRRRALAEATLQAGPSKKAKATNKVRSKTRRKA